MSHFPHIKYAGLSDVGRKRKNNEDSYGLFPEIGVFCVADGMGGGDDGEVASAATVRAIEMFAKANPLQSKVGYSKESMIAGLRGAVNSASSWILKRAQEKGLKGCGSTFVGVLIDPCSPDTPIALHAGDSRLYRIRGRSIQQITKDHSAAELIGAKDENEINPMFRGMILRAVGIQKSVEVDATPFQVKQGDRILICSDGLSKMISDKQIASIVKESDTVEAAVKELVSAANEAGGFDNVTAVLVEVGKLPPALPTVELDVPRFDEVADDAVYADRHTLDTSSETGVSFDLGTATSSTNTSCRTEGTRATEQSTVTIPEDDSECVADSGKFEAGASVNADETTADSSEVETKPKSRARLWIAVVAITLVAAAAAVVLFGGENKSSSAEKLRLVDRPSNEGTNAYEIALAEKAAEEKAKAERIRLEQEAEERLRKEKEARAEQERLRREVELKRAEEERIRREKEMERAREVQRRKEEKARQQAEQERLRKEKEEALKLAEEERIRKAAELKKAEEERKRREAEQERMLKLEKERAEKEKALLEQLTKKKSAALAERRRKAAFEALRRVSEDKSAIAFVRKIRGIADNDSVNDICRMFRPVLTAHTKEEMEKSAVSLIRVMQPIVVKLTECADMYKSDALAELKDPMTSADYKKELKDVPAKMDDFLRNSRRIIGKDAEDFDVHLACAHIIEMVPLWFDAF
jgi:protein phosphatase